MTKHELDAQRARVLASVRLAEEPKDRHNVYPLRPRPVTPGPPRAA
jgi:hypothetical protein